MICKNKVQFCSCPRSKVRHKNHWAPLEHSPESDLSLHMFFETLGLQTSKLTFRQSFSILTAGFLSCLSGLYLSELDIHVIFAVLQ